MDSFLIRDQVEALLKKIGIETVDFSIVQLRGGYWTVRVIIYRPQGASLDDCSEAYRLVEPHLHTFCDTRNVNLEISSPGIDRVLKNKQEYTIFKGALVKILTQDDKWFEGMLCGMDDNDEVLLDTEDGMKNYSIEDIKKAKLNSGGLL